MFKINQLCKKVSNFVNISKEALAILDKFIDEARHGQITAYHGIAFYFVSVFCVAKKDKWGLYTLFRVVRNGSFAIEGTISLNSIIRKRKCAMPTLPNLHIYAEVFDRNNSAAVRDLRDWFRRIPLFTEDQKYVLYSICGYIFNDCAQPYGISSAVCNVFCVYYLLFQIIDI